MSDEQGLKLQLELLIFSEASQVCISTKSNEAQDVTTIKTRLGPITLYDAIGGKCLSRTCKKPMYEIVRTPYTDNKGAIKTSMARGREFSFWEKIQKSLSISYPITESELLALLTPFFKLGATKLFLCTTCNSRGVANNTNPEILKLLGIVENRWECFSDIESARPTFNGGFHKINEICAKYELSDLRIRSVGVDIVREQGEKIEELKKIVESLQKALAK